MSTNGGKFNSLRQVVKSDKKELWTRSVVHSEQIEKWPSTHARSFSDMRSLSHVTRIKAPTNRRRYVFLQQVQGCAPNEEIRKVSENTPPPLRSIQSFAICIFQLFLPSPRPQESRGKCSFPRCSVAYFVSPSPKESDPTQAPVAPPSPHPGSAGGVPADRAVQTPAKLKRFSRRHHPERTASVHNKQCLSTVTITNSDTVTSPWLHQLLSFFSVFGTTIISVVSRAPTLGCSLRNVAFKTTIKQ